MKSSTILVVVADPLVPLTGGGAVRLFKIIDYLREVGFRVELAIPHPGPKGMRLLKDRADRIWTVPDFLPKLDAMQRDCLPDFLSKPIHNFIDRRVLQEQKRRRKKLVKGNLTSIVVRKINPALCDLVERVARKHKPRAVLCQYAWTAKALDQLPKDVLKIVDTIDIQHQRRGRAQEVGSDLPGHNCTLEEELQELARADVLLAIQRHELEILDSMSSDYVVCLAEHAEESKRHLRSPERSRTVFFVGSLYDPNVLGAKEFIEKAWPKIRAAVPNSEFVVCGRVCEALDDGVPGIRYEGVVPTLDPYYEQAAVVINPVPYGSGLKIKTVEAMAYGKSLVATPSAVYGLEDSKAPFIVSEIDGMADAIIPLLLDHNARSEREIQTWRYAQNRFAAKNVYRDLELILRAGRAPARNSRLSGTDRKADVDGERR